MRNFCKAICHMSIIFTVLGFPLSGLAQGSCEKFDKVFSAYEKSQVELKLQKDTSLPMPSVIRIQPEMVATLKAAIGKISGFNSQEVKDLWARYDADYNQREFACLSAIRAGLTPALFAMSLDNCYSYRMMIDAEEAARQQVLDAVGMPGVIRLQDDILDKCGS